MPWQDSISLEELARRNEESKRLAEERRQQGQTDDD